MSDINFVEVNPDTIQNDLINDFETSLNETLYPGDERRIFLQNFMPVLIALKNDINNTGRANLLRYMYEDILDAYAEPFGVIRLSAQKALVTLQFTLSAAQAFDITIPLGTRATPDGTLFFATKSDLIIPAGDTTGSITSEATISGASHNGFTSGQIKNIVDPITYVSTVSNTDTSIGGSDAETDDELRERIRLAPSSFSVAGPSNAYKYWALTADKTISDISISSPTPGSVQLVVLMDGGVIPSQIILDKVFDVVNSDNIRPLTDNVSVVAATASDYAINFTYYINRDDSTLESSIRASIENSGGVVDQYKVWQSEKLGRDINPDELRKRVLNAGAYKLTMVNPVATDLDDTKVAQNTTVTITYGGLIDP